MTFRRPGDLTASCTGFLRSEFVKADVVVKLRGLGKRLVPFGGSDAWAVEVERLFGWKPIAELVRVEGDDGVEESEARLFRLLATGIRDFAM